MGWPPSPQSEGDGYTLLGSGRDCHHPSRWERHDAHLHFNAKGMSTLLFFCWMAGLRGIPNLTKKPAKFETKLSAFPFHTWTVRLESPQLARTFEIAASRVAVHPESVASRKCTPARTFFAIYLNSSFSDVMVAPSIFKVKGMPILLSIGDGHYSSQWEGMVATSP